jgi:hypothetical protein
VGELILAVKNRKEVSEHGSLAFFYQFLANNLGLERF